MSAVRPRSADEGESSSGPKKRKRQNRASPVFDALRARAVPLGKTYIGCKWLSRVVRAGDFKSRMAPDELDSCVRWIAEHVSHIHVKRKDGPQGDNYFFSAGLNIMRSALDVADEFLKSKGYNFHRNKKKPRPG